MSRYQHSEAETSLIKIIAYAITAFNAYGLYQAFNNGSDSWLTYSWICLVWSSLICVFGSYKDTAHMFTPLDALISAALYTWTISLVHGSNVDNGGLFIGIMTFNFFVSWAKVLCQHP